MIGLVLALAGGAALAGEPEPERGAAIYTQGLGAAPRIAGTGIRLPEGRLGCAGCHGADGRGGGEGGLAAPPVTWRALSRANDRRPAYDAAGLVRAVREGIDAGGLPLDPAMPRFDMTPADLAALIDHLAALDSVPGVTPERLLLGAPADPAVAAGYAAAIATEGGGAFGRDLSLASEEAVLIGFDDVAALLAPRWRAAEVALLVRTLRADGVTRLALAPPDAPLGEALRAAGLTLDAAAPDAVLTEHPPENFRRHVYGFAENAASLRAAPTLGMAVTLVGPRPAALIWARDAGATSAAVTAWVYGAIITRALRDLGRDPTRERIEARLATMPLDWAVETYRYDLAK